MESTLKCARMDFLAGVAGDWFVGAGGDERDASFDEHGLSLLAEVESGTSGVLPKPSRSSPAAKTHVPVAVSTVSQLYLFTHSSPNSLLFNSASSSGRYCGAV